MAKLQSQILNNVMLTTKVSNTEQIAQFVDDSIGEISGKMPDMSKLGLTYRSTEEEKKIALSYDGTEIGSIDASDFVKDGMISAVSYDEGTHILSILWNSDGDSKVTEINLSGLIDTYTAGEGLTCDKGVFSLTAEIPSKTSDLENDAGFATSSYVDSSCSDLSSTLTGWIDEQGYLTEHQSLSDYATEEWVEGQNYLTEHQSLSDYYAKGETSSAVEISGALAGKQPVGDYATSAYVDGQIQLSTHHYSAGDGIIIEDNPLNIIGPGADTSHRIKIDEDYTATKSYVDEGHGYLSSGYTVEAGGIVFEQTPYGKRIRLAEDVARQSDYYQKYVLDRCLSAVSQYDSPEKVPLSAVVVSIWCLGQLQNLVAEEG